MRTSRHARSFRGLVLSLLALAVCVSPPALGGFAGTELVIPAVARSAGAGSPPAQFYSTLWVTNLSPGTSAAVRIWLLKDGQANPVPQEAEVQTLAPGETRRFDNVLQQLFGLTDSASGALRLMSNVPILASSRTYDQPIGTDISQAKGLFFSAIPATFSAALGETAYLQGVSQGGSESFRYNYGLVETSGQEGPTLVRVTLRSALGSVLATSTPDVSLGAFERRQWSVATLHPGIATTNARLEATVVAGPGRVMLYGTGIANGSQDSAGFEMSFKDGLLAESTASGAETLAASVATSAVSAARTSYDVSPRLAPQGAAPGTGALAGAFPSPDADPVFGAYDPATGWWTVSTKLDSGQSATVQLRFKDASGGVQKFYNPLTTELVETKGQGAGLQGAIGWDLTLLGVKLSAAALTIGGSGSGTYQGTSGTFTVSSVVLPKSAGAYPTSGTVAVTANGLTVTVAFDGTQYASASYTYLGHSVTFTIDLATGEVTRP